MIDIGMQSAGYDYAWLGLLLSVVGAVSYVVSRRRKRRASREH